MDLFEILRKYKKEIKNAYSVKRIGLFGSYVRGDSDELSDIDVLVEFDNSTYDNFINLVFFLEDLFKKSVDLVTIGGLSPYIGPYIQKEVEWC